MRIPDRVRSTFALVFALGFGSAVIVGGARSSAAPAGIQGAGGTTLAVINRDAVQSAVVIADFYRQGGVAPPLQIARPFVPARDAALIDDGGVLTRGAYDVIASSDRSIDTRAIFDWAASGGALASESVDVGNEVLLPLVMIKYNGQTSLVTIQNTDTGQVATVSVELFAQGEAMAVVTKAYQVMPGGSITLDLGKDAAFVGVRPNTAFGFLGSMRVASAVVIGAEVIQDVETSQQATYSYAGWPHAAAATRLHVPLIVHGAARDADHLERTLIGVQNANDVGPAVVRASFTGLAGPCAGRTFTSEPRTVSRLGMTLFDTAEPSFGEPLGPVPDGCVATARIEADGPVVAAVVLMRFQPGQPSSAMAAGATNAMPSSAAADAWLAWPWERTGAASGAESEAIVFNPGDQAASVTLTPKRADGGSVAACGAPCTATVAAGASVVMRSADDAGITDSFDGTALIASDRPVIVWLRSTSPDGHRDDTLMAAVSLGGEPGQRSSFRPLFLRAGTSGRPTPLPPSPTSEPTRPSPTATETMTDPTSTPTAEGTMSSPTPNGAGETPTATPSEPAPGPTASLTARPTSPPPTATASATATAAPPTATPLPPHFRTVYLPWSRTDAGLADVGSPARPDPPRPVAAPSL